MKRNTLIALALSLAACFSQLPLGLGASVVRAQTSPSLNLTFGVMTGIGGGERSKRKGPHADLTLLVRRHAKNETGPLFGVGIGATGSTASSADACSTTDTSRCVPFFPRLRYVSALAGAEFGSGAADFLAGPVYAKTPEGETGVGVEGRMQVNRDGARYYTSTVSVHMAVMPKIDGSAIMVLGVGVGLRLKK